jgi:hypothetical protein
MNNMSAGGCGVPVKTFDVAKQFGYALATALTAVAIEARDSSIKSIESAFTIRNNWDKPSNAMGIKALPATKDDLSSAVATRADWLIPHEEGGIKTPQGRFIAVPSANVRRTKRDIIRKGQRPKALRGKAFVLHFKKGGYGLFQRKGRGKNSQLIFLYRLIKTAKIKKRPTVIPATVKTFERRFDAIFYDKLRDALKTAK